MAIITNSTVKSYLNIDKTSDDALIDSMIAYNTSIIEDYINQNIESVSITKAFFGNVNIFDGAYRFNHSLVSSITSLEYKENIGDSSFISISSSNFTLYENAGVYYLDNNLGWSAGSYYRLIYTAGFVTVPETIKQVLLEMVVKNYLDSSNGDTRFGLASSTDSSNGTSATTSYKDLSPEWKMKLYKYRILP